VTSDVMCHMLVLCFKSNHSLQRSQKEHQDENDICARCAQESCRVFCVFQPFCYLVDCINRAITLTVKGCPESILTNNNLPLGRTLTCTTVCFLACGGTCTRIIEPAFVPGGTSKANVIPSGLVACKVCPGLTPGGKETKMLCAPSRPPRDPKASSSPKGE
jgi:hypothetical protein